ncbi:multi-copy leucine-rich repeat protein, putative [Bodo saltans]|uniref:Multi-copy leucine-rich repeat protein, putative n=1 Tax=Bodo saltans TaxID=75058 RepID=A0A0S4KI79_BODSA|nr:multi-copy leucine-rich repeat protein, putative [Bodo saltans]|eukprot:CUI14240.1 multi-copy leucine-rich repeat protein, putative [Bodo saltans]
MRMVYSVVDTSINSASSSAFQTFARNVAKYCDLDQDYKNFEYIVGALRKQLDWEGPMFVAIDEFLVPYFKTKYQRQLSNGLKTICEDMLDDARPLLVTPGVEHTVYSRYVAVSVYHAVDTVRLSTMSGRPLIAQPMPLLSARDVAQLANHRFSDDLHRSSYIEILGNQRTNVCELRPHQLIILLHIALSTGAPRTMSKWLTRHEIQYRVELLQRQFYRRVTTTTNDTKSHTTATTNKGGCFHPTHWKLYSGTLTAA